MKISELIKYLEQEKKINGDIEIEGLRYKYGDWYESSKLDGYIVNNKLNLLWQ